jgi:bDLD-like protein
VIPQAFFGPVFSGEKVMADQAGIDALKLDWPKAIGVEMEGLGVAAASYRGGPGFLIVKAVSDFADFAKNDDWQPYAAASAACFAVAVLRRASLDTEPARPQALPLAGPVLFPGRVKLYVCQRILNDWEDIADLFDVPPHAKARFRAGNEPRDLWEWLDARAKLHALPDMLNEIGRPDLAEVMRTRPI